MRRKLKKIGLFIWRPLKIVALVCILFYLSLVIFLHPSNTRDWSTDLAILPYAEFEGDLITVHNIRNFKYQSVLDYTPAYYDKTFDLKKIKSVDFIVEPFSGLAAHTFVAFGFSDGSYVDISIEVRREKGEFFDAVKGLFRQFELTYVVSDENDVLKLRTNIRKDNVYLYPIKTTPEKMKLLFTDMLTRANTLKDMPEFYNTVTSNCTTNIADHVNRISPNKIPWSLKVIFPHDSDELALDIGLINDTGTIEEVRARHLITPIAQKYGDSPDFSLKIRALK